MNTESNATEKPLTSSQAFVNEMNLLIDSDGVDHILDMQNEMYSFSHPFFLISVILIPRKYVLASSNEAMSKMNEFAETEYNKLETEYLRHARMMREMKKDLEYVFQKLKYVIVA
jgi:hypothetical protein